MTLAIGPNPNSRRAGLCSFHRTLVHEGGFGVRTAADGAFVFTRPDGARIADCGRRFRGDFSDRSLEVLNAEQGLKIDARTSRCRWVGESMDYSQAIEWMQFEDERAAREAHATRSALQ